MTYKYKCTQGHTFEVEQKISHKPIRRCRHTMESILPDCHVIIRCEARCERVPNNETGFILYGTGFPGKDGKGK